MFRRWLTAIVHLLNSPKQTFSVFDWEVAEIKGCSDIVGAISIKETDWKAQILTLAPNTWGKSAIIFTIH